MATGILEKKENTYEWGEKAKETINIVLLHCTADPDPV